MKVAIRYYSKTGNTKKLAEGLGGALGVKPETVEVPLTEAVDVLFIGTAYYAFNLDEQVKAFIDTLDANKVKKVVNFSSAAMLSSTDKQVAKCLAARGITMDSRSFACRGQFKKIHSGRPNAEDIKALQTFGLEIVGKAQGGDGRA